MKMKELSGPHKGGGVTNERRGRRVGWRIRTGAATALLLSPAVAFAYVGNAGGIGNIISNTGRLTAPMVSVGMALSGVLGLFFLIWGLINVWQSSNGQEKGKFKSGMTMLLVAGAFLGLTYFITDLGNQMYGTTPTQTTLSNAQNGF